ncbi:MAG: DUF11 domain-containing protein [Sulfurimonas sp.]|nr:DUF11 domain-containing protein [Sulfurimonas sp.]
MISISRIFIITTFFFGLSHANENILLEVKAEEEIVVVKKDGTKTIKYVGPESIVPGDIVRYRIFYHNLSQEIAESVVITNPIPKEMEYLSGSASGSGIIIFFSIDGAKTFKLPQNLVVTDKYGNQRIATAKEYTHIQWRFNKAMQPQAQDAVYYRAKLK